MRTIRIRASLAIMLFLLLGGRINAQSGTPLFEQVYPEFKISPIGGSVAWNGDTLYLAAYEGLIMRSIDAGLSWENLYPADRLWNFYRAAETEAGIFLLGEPTVWNPVQLPACHRAALLRYDPSANRIEPLPFPRLPCVDSGVLDYVGTYDIAAGGNALFLLQDGPKVGISVHRSQDAGLSWEAIPLPDSLRAGYASFICAYDSSNFALHIATRIDGVNNFSVMITTDGGASWGPASPFKESANQYRPWRNKVRCTWLAAGHLIAFVREGGLYETRDGGRNWSWISSPPFLDLFSIVSCGNGRGYALADQKLFRTDDGFQSFTPLLPEYWFDALAVKGTDTLLATRYTGNIFMSADAGASWDVPRWSPLWIEGVRMADDVCGVAYVEDLDRGQDFWCYYRTDDGWEHMEYLGQETDYGQHACMVYPISKTLWYRCQYFVRQGRPIVQRSLDGGRNWSDVLSPGDIPELPVNVSIYPATIRDTSYFGFITEQTMVFTSDRGEHWTHLRLPLNGRSYQTDLRPQGPSWLLVQARGDGSVAEDSVLFSTGDWTKWEPVLVEPDVLYKKVLLFRYISAYDDGRAYVHGRYDTGVDPGFPRGDFVAATTDYGRQWELYPGATGSDGAVYLPDGGSFSASKGTARWGNVTGGNMLMHSVDGWRTSTLEDVHYSATTIEDVIPAGEKSVYLVSFSTIYRNSTGGVNAVSPSAPAPAILDLGTPYPHPVTNGMTVRIPVEFDASSARTLNVTLHDILGREVQRVFTSELSESIRAIPWTVRGLTSGTYILRIRTDVAMRMRTVIVR